MGEPVRAPDPTGSAPRGPAAEGSSAVPSKTRSADDAVADIADGAVVTVSSSSGLGCPDRVLRALGERFGRTGQPRALTTVHPIAAGDLYGIDGIEHLARDGMLERVVAGSYPSGPASKPMPGIWKMIVEDRIAAYNVPSGILFDMHRDVAARRPGVLTAVGLDTFVDPEREGCAMNARAAAAPIVHRHEMHGRTWLHFPNIVPSVGIVRATTADGRGNLSFEHEGALLGALEQAVAVKSRGGTVIAQVSRTTAGAMRPHEVHVPGHLVDRVVVDPDQRQTTGTDYDPAISGQTVRPWEDFPAMPMSVEKLIARRAAMELAPGQVANLGFGLSAAVPGILLEEGHPRAVTWVVEQGAVGGVPLTGFAFGCAANADAFVPSPVQFAYFQGGGFDVAFLSFMEIDVDGCVNVSRLGARPYLTAGCGGFVDITSHAPRLVFSGLFEVGAELELGAGSIRVARPGKRAKMVEAVEHVTFAGRRAEAEGRDVLYLTERCAMRLGERGLVAVEIAPGIDPERDIARASEGRVSVADDVAPMPASLFADGPMGLWR